MKNLFKKSSALRQEELFEQVSFGRPKTIFGNMAKAGRKKDAEKIPWINVENFLDRFTVYILLLLLCSSLVADEGESIKRIYAHLLIHDPISAVKEAQAALKEYPKSERLKLAYIRALSEKGDETAVLQEWATVQDGQKDRHLLEILAWGVLNKGENSSQLTVRSNSLIGASFTHDVRALPLLISEMRGTNAMLRSLAVKLATFYGDGPLQQELGRMLKEEKVWYVRLEVIQAIGALRMSALREDLKDIIGNSKTLAEEKAAAILALVSIYDSVGPSELKNLLKSNRAGLRQLACGLIAHFDMKEYAGEVKNLLRDASPDVRMEALYTLGLLKENVFLDELPFQDSSPAVSITAGWVAMLLGYEEGEKILEKWMNDSHPDWRRLAAGALSVTGKVGIGLSLQEIKKNADPYVRATLCIGLIGQRQNVPLACDVLYSVFKREKSTLWMWDDHLLFRSLSPSHLRHIEQIPNYPHVVNQLVRLDILTILSILRYPKAEEGVKDLLKDQNWGVTGAAAATLIEEGDEEALNLVRGLLDEKDQKIRVQAALILAILGGDPLAIKVLKEVYPSMDREMKVHILEAMGRIGDPETIPFLIDVLKEPFQMLRVVAASALIQCLYH